MRARTMVLALIVLGLAACGRAQETAPRATSPTGVASPAAPKCRPSGTTLKITAEDHKFDKDCLAAPANQAFTIKFTSRDDHKHNVAIESTSGVTPYFNGKLITGVKTIEYKVKPLPAGTYRFECDVHASIMSGTFVVV